RGAADRDHHRVAGADLEELLRSGQPRHPHPGDDLTGPQDRALDTGDELGEGHRALPLPAGQHDRGVGGQQHRQPVAGRARGGDVAADGGGVAHLRRADGAGRGGERGKLAGELALDGGPGDRGADVDLVGTDLVALQLRHPADGDDRRRPAVAEVDLHHEVGAAGEQVRVREGVQRVEGVLQRRGSGDDGHGSSYQPWPGSNAGPGSGAPSRRTVPSMRPYGRSSAWKTSLRLSSPNGLRSTAKWCLLGSEKRISAMPGCSSSTAAPIAYRVCCRARLWWPANTSVIVASTAACDFDQSTPVSVCHHCAVTEVAMMRSSVGASVV